MENTTCSASARKIRGLIELSVVNIQDTYFGVKPTKEIIKAIKFKGKGSIKPPEDSLVLLVPSIKPSFGVWMNADMIMDDT